MPMFGFDEQYAYYGTTPVDNRFILEYLPNATGDAVRVYLYGLVQCYAPDQTMTIEKMARELSLTEEDVLKAYRYWERKGLVRRVADHPPTYKYVNAQQAFNGDACLVDQEYAEFCASLQDLFGDRRIHGGELTRCYEWVEQMDLPADAVLYLIGHMIRLNGKSVAIKTIEKRAMQLADEGVSSLEDAKIILDFDLRVISGSRELLSKMGKRRHPTEAELKLYRTWVTDWQFTDADILAACAEMTSGDPSFKYLGGILGRLYNKRQGAENVAELIEQENAAVQPLKALLATLNDRNAAVNAGTLEEYRRMRELYPDAIILMAGRECAKRGANFSGVLSTLKNWKNNNLSTAEDVRAYMQRVDDLNDFLLMLYDVLGVSVKPNASDRRLAALWLEDYELDMTFVTQCAAFAIGKDKPIPYLAAMLDAFHQKGITSIEAARQEREAFQQRAAASVPARTGKIVGEQQYAQREYTHSEDAMDAMMKKWQEENGDA